MDSSLVVEPGPSKADSNGSILVDVTANINLGSGKNNAKISSVVGELGEGSAAIPAVPSVGTVGCVQVAGKASVRKAMAAKRGRGRPRKNALKPRASGRSSRGKGRGRTTTAVALFPNPRVPKRAVLNPDNILDYEDSDSGGEEDDKDRRRRKMLKRMVITFLNENVSPRQFVRLRNEVRSAKTESPKEFDQMKGLAPESMDILEQLFVQDVHASLENQGEDNKAPGE